MFDFYYNYLKKYLEGENDPRSDDDEFIREHAEYATIIFEAEQRAGTLNPGEVALKSLMNEIDCYEEPDGFL